MWFIQTPVDGLILPTDSLGRVTLTGSASPWHHIVRNNIRGVEKDGVAIASVAVRWTIWSWQQHGSRVHVNDSPLISAELLQMVRDEPHRVCTQATLGAHGKRQSDSTIELHIVVPPDQFSRYEASVQFAMTLPSGMIALTLPDPLVASHYSDKPRHLLSHGQSCLMEGLEIVVSRAKVTKFTRRDLQVERRAPRIVEAPAHVLNDHGDEWYLFRREEAEEKDIF